MELSAITEESIGYSLILSRFAAKSITSPLLNVSTVRIYGLSTIAVVAIELMDTITELVEYARRNKSKSIDVVGPIKEIAGIVNRIIKSLSDLQKNRGGESIIEFMNQLKLIGEKIRQLELDSEVKMVLANICEKVRNMFRFITNYYLVSAIYPD